MTKLNENERVTVDQPFKQADWLAKISDMTGESRKSVEKVLKAIPDIIKAHLQAGHVCSLMGLLKFHTAEKAATAEKEVINPFNNQPMTIAAKPAHKVVRVKALKKLKEMVGETGDDE